MKRSISIPDSHKKPQLKTSQLAEITALPYNLRTISSHVTGENPD
ncbi:MAG: hypothetical protein ABIO19_07240 [Burkholderiaceae bacterium]